MKKNKITIKQIFEDNYEEFWKMNKEKYPEKMREHMNIEVMKMIGCGDIALGFVAYICLKCLEVFKVGFTCKSRFCSKCGKKYINEWVEKQVSRILDVPHRHCVFTIPSEYRKYFFGNRESLKDLQDMVHEVINEFANGVNYKNRKEYQKKKRSKKGGVLWQSGMIGVVHTFGRNIGFNPHVHALVPEIKTRGNEVKDMGFFDYEYFRKVWQYKLINYMISKNPEKKAEYLKMFKDYPNGFYINAKSRMKSARGAARYIGRYLGRPAIAEYRIISYDGKNVTFWYKSHETNERVEETVTAQVFIGKLLMHISPKYFKMVRLYGVYAGSISVKVRKCFGLLQYIKSGLKLIQCTLKINWKKEIRKMKYRELMIINFSKDPRKCSKCGQLMELFQIWHRKYGYIYDMGTY
jgi:hypothetical protein